MCLQIKNAMSIRQTGMVYIIFYVLDLLYLHQWCRKEGREMQDKSSGNLKLAGNRRTNYKSLKWWCISSSCKLSVIATLTLSILFLSIKNRLKTWKNFKFDTCKWKLPKLALHLETWFFQTENFLVTQTDSHPCTILPETPFSLLKQAQVPCLIKTLLNKT